MNEKQSGLYNLGDILQLPAHGERSAIVDIARGTLLQEGSRGHGMLALICSTAASPRLPRMQLKLYLCLRASPARP
jgi:hypothetical protein